MFGKKSLKIDGTINLNYMHEGSWILASVSTKNDVTIIEAFRFLDRVKDMINE